MWEILSVTGYADEIPFFVSSLFMSRPGRAPIFR